MPHLSPSINRGRSPSSNNGCGTNTGNGSSERTHHLLHHSVVASANNTGADLNLIYNVKPRSSNSTTNQDGGRSLPRPARKNYHHQRSPAGAGAGTNGTIISGWRSRSSEAANGGGRSQFMSRSYAAPTISSRTHQQMQQQQQQRQRGQLSRSHEERALRSISVGRQSLTTASKNGLNNHSIQQQQSQQHPPPSYSSNPVIQSTLSNSITSSSGSRNALAASITQQVMKYVYCCYRDFVSSFF